RGIRKRGDLEAERHPAILAGGRPPRPDLDFAAMKIGFKTSQTNVDWPTLVATWELADERPILDSGWLFDHFVALGEGGGGSHEAFTMLAALAARTKRLQLGHLVLSN